MNPLMQQQQFLQNEANELLGKLALSSTLNQIGEMSVVGSVELGLMTWRDIDLEVLVPALNKAHISQVVNDVMKKSLRRVDFTFIDNSNAHKPGMPTGYYLGIQFEVEKDKVWKIDTWFVEGSHTDGYTQTQEMKDKLTEQNQEAILVIKNELWNHPKYRKEIQSVDIYEAVLNHRIKDLGGFEKYLHTIGKSLD